MRKKDRDRIDLFLNSPVFQSDIKTIRDIIGLKEVLKSKDKITDFLIDSKESNALEKFKIGFIKLFKKYYLSDNWTQAIYDIIWYGKVQETTNLYWVRKLYVENLEGIPAIHLILFPDTTIRDLKEVFKDIKKIQPHLQKGIFKKHQKTTNLKENNNIDSMEIRDKELIKMGLDPDKDMYPEAEKEIIVKLKERCKKQRQNRRKSLNKFANQLKRL